MCDKKQPKNPKFLQKEEKKTKQEKKKQFYEIYIFHSITPKSMTWYLVLGVETHSCPITKGPKFSGYLKLFFFIPSEFADLNSA